MTDTTLTYEEEYAWESLRGRSAQFIMKHGTVGDIVQKSSDLLHGQSSATIDECFSILVDKELSPVDTLRIVRLWLLNDKIALSPNRLTCFNEFHNRYSKFTFRKPGHTYTAEEEEVYTQVQAVLGSN